MCTISIRIDVKEKKLIKKIAKFNNVRISTYIKKAIFEKLEDEYDLIEYEKAYAEYLKNPVTIGFDDVFKKIDEAYKELETEKTK